MTASRRRVELLELAEAVLEREGLAGFGVGSLARAAGVKPPSLYKHFDGLPDLEAALISRGFAAFARDIADATEALPADAGPRDRVAAFARTYRSHALAHPQLYRMMTGGPLDRDRLDDGAEGSAMADLLALFGEDETDYATARAAWAWAHGLVVLEIADRFPPGADLDASWDVLIDTMTARAAGARS